jgi:L-arabinose isomerase
MEKLNKLEIWFITGTQHLYGPETLKQVANDSKAIAAALDKSTVIPVKVVFKPILTTPDSIFELCSEANNSKNCIGLIAWMHTFSPAKMWIRGLNILHKPFLHLHTLEHHRHGFYESEPVCPRRQGVWIHNHTDEA